MQLSKKFKKEGKEGGERKKEGRKGRKEEGSMRKKSYPKCKESKRSLSTYDTRLYIENPNELKTETTRDNKFSKVVRRQYIRKLPFLYISKEQS